MQIEGRVKDIAIDYQTGDTIVSFLTSRKPKEIESECIRLRDKDLDIEIKVHREKRSLNANGYFHVLVGKIADEIGRSKTYVKNDLITSYGQQLIIDNEPVSIKTQIPPDLMWETETLHCLFVGTKTENDKTLYFYNVFRGSHTYDTKEMSVLIDGTVQIAKDMGIDTMTNAQLEQLKALWKGYENAPSI